MALTQHRHHRLWGAALASLLASAPLAAQGTPGIERVNGSVQIDFQGTDMRLVVAALAEAAGLNVVYGDLPSRPVTLRTGAPVPVSMLRTYLESLLKANGMELVDEGGGLLRIVSTGGGGEADEAQGRMRPRQGQPVAGPPGQVRVWVHRLRHAPAEDIARSVGALFGIGDLAALTNPGLRSLSEELRDQRYPAVGEEPGVPGNGQGRGISAGLQSAVQIVPDQRTNALLIRATAADYETLRQAIDELDQRPLQVLIEVLIAEVRRNRQLGLGIDVSVPDQRLDDGTVVGGRLFGGDAGDVLVRINRLGGIDANVVLRALASSGEVSILSRPVILAQNNEEARILVGDQRPFIQVSRSLPTETAQRDQVVQYRDVGTQLTIRPTVNPDGYVTLHVLQEVSSATDQVQFGAPVISTREAETRLLVKDGHTVVIGGLVDQVRSRTNSGIPFLKDLPLLGPLFRSTTTRDDVTELFLFLIPHVLRTDEELDETTERVRERAPRLDRVLPDSIPLFWVPRDSAGAAPGGEGTFSPQGGAPQPAPRQPRESQTQTGQQEPMRPRPVQPQPTQPQPGQTQPYAPPAPPPQPVPPASREED